MANTDSVTIWIKQLKQGDEDAAQQLWQKYFCRLIQLAHHKLGGLSKRVSDEEDIALSAFHSFCRAVEQERFPQLNNRDDLWQILVMHTARKVSAQRRYQGRKKRGGDEAHVPLDLNLLEIIGSEPDPQFAAEMTEQFELLLNELNCEDLRVVALRRLEGYTNEEIADELGFGESTIRRKVALIRRCWQDASFVCQDS